MRFADLMLARRLEAAETHRHLDYAVTRGTLRPDIGVAWEPIAGGCAVFAGAGNPFSRAIGLGLHGPMTDTDLARLEAFYAGRGLAPEVSLCPLADESLVQLLGAHGYRIRMFMHTWIREPARPATTTTNASPKSDAGLVVRPIRPDEADLWVRTVSRGFEGEHAAASPDSIVAAYPHLAHASCWLAWLDGQPAGAGSLAIYDGVAELFGASTRSAYRGRGVQTALMQARMDAAVAAGCDLIAVHTDPGSASQRNVERAGFRLAYTNVRVQRASP